MLATRSLFTFLGARDNGTHKKPSPTCDPSSTIHELRNHPGQQPRDGASYGNRGIQPRIPRRELILSVPRGQVESAPGSKAGLKEADQEPQTKDLVPVLARPLTGGGNAPKDGEGREVDAGPHPAEDHVGWDLTDDVGREEDEDDDGVLGGGQLEVLLQPACLCIAYVGAVDVGQEVEGPTARLYGEGQSRHVNCSSKVSEHSPQAASRACGLASCSLASWGRILSPAAVLPAGRADACCRRPTRPSQYCPSGRRFELKSTL